MTSPAEIVERFDRDRHDFLPLLSPDADLAHLHAGGVLPFAPERFPAEFLKALIPAPAVGRELARASAGAPRYPIRVIEDRRTRERIILNAAGEELARLPAPPDYDPHAFAKERFARQMLDNRRHAARLLAIYDPARIAVGYELVAEKDLGV